MAFTHSCSHSSWRHPQFVAAWRQDQAKSLRQHRARLSSQLWIDSCPVFFYVILSTKTNNESWVSNCWPINLGQLWANGWLTSSPWWIATPQVVCVCVRFFSTGGADSSTRGWFNSLNCGGSTLVNDYFRGLSNVTRLQGSFMFPYIESCPDMSRYVQWLQWLQCLHWLHFRWKSMIWSSWILSALVFRWFFTALDSAPAMTQGLHISHWECAVVADFTSASEGTKPPQRCRKV